MGQGENWGNKLKKFANVEKALYICRNKTRKIMETMENKINEVAHFISWVVEQRARLQEGGLDVSAKMEYDYHGELHLTAFVWKGTEIVKSCWGTNIADEKQYDKFCNQREAFEKFLSMTPEQINAAYYQQQIEELQKRIAENGK